MQMMKVFLKGPRSNRTPLSYPEYRSLFLKRGVEYAGKPEDADLLVYSCLIDIRDDLDELSRIFSRRPDIRLVVLSEEPLWDSLWSGDCFSKKGSITIGERTYPYTFLNHCTTRIYDFERIPYFITTSDDFFARYAFLFARNRAFQGPELTALWDKAPVRAAFYAERQIDAQFDVYSALHDVWGLCRYRTLVAQGMTGDGIARIGKRWGNTTVRQLLPDWHLDKLAALDRRSCLVSAIENTHQWNYVSEKIFDAYAVLGVPLYFAGPLHAVRRLAPAESFINVYGLTVDQALHKISLFNADREFVAVYREAQAALAEIFLQPKVLAQERGRVASEVLSELEAL
jgi:hypothetical protein